MFGYKRLKVLEEKLDELESKLGLVWDVSSGKYGQMNNGRLAHLDKIIKEKGRDIWLRRKQS